MLRKAGHVNDGSTPDKHQVVFCIARTTIVLVRVIVIEAMLQDRHRSISCDRKKLDYEHEYKRNRRPGQGAASEDKFGPEIGIALNAR